VKAGKRKEVRAPDQEQRDMIILYKRVFGSEDGKAVLCDLMNRNFILDSHGGDALKEGRRQAILEVMTKANMNIEQFDKLLKGEL
jgi:hypothetical protein